MWEKTRDVPGIRRLLGVTVAVTIGVTGLAVADPDLANVNAHRHFVTQTDGSLVAVGPDLCDNPNLQKAVNQFHNNAHVASASSQGPAAPGLHNGIGAEIVARPCSFHP